MKHKYNISENSKIRLFLLFISISLFTISLTVSVEAIPRPTAVYGFINISPVQEVDITIVSNYTGTEIITDIKKTSTRISDGAYSGAVGSDTSPNLDITVYATSQDKKYSATKTKRDINPGDITRIDLQMKEITEDETITVPEEPEEPSTESSETSSGGGGGGGAGGGGSPTSPRDTERESMPPLDSDNEDFVKYASQYYNQTLEEFERWKEDNQDLMQRLEEEQERQANINLLLEFTLYGVILIAITITYLIYKEKKKRFILDVLVKDYVKDKKKDKKKR